MQNYEGWSPQSLSLSDYLLMSLIAATMVQVHIKMAIRSASVQITTPVRADILNKVLSGAQLLTNMLFICFVCKGRPIRYLT